MLKQWFKSKEKPKELTADLADIVWIDLKENKVSPIRNDGECYIRMSVHKNEIMKRHEMSRTVAPLKWKVTNGTFKTFTAKAADRYYQIFVLDAGTCTVLVSTREFAEPPSQKSMGEHVYLLKTLNQVKVADVIRMMDKLHSDFIRSALEGE